LLKSVPSFPLNLATWKPDPSGYFSSSYKTNRVLANLILIDEDDLQVIKSSSLKECIIKLCEDLPNHAEKILESQMICGECVKALIDGNHELFLSLRAKNIINEAVKQVSYQLDDL
jgi:hypothetical protein